MPDIYTVTGSVLTSRYPGSVQVIVRVPGPVPLAGVSVSQAEVVRAFQVPSLLVVIWILAASVSLTASVLSIVRDSPAPSSLLLLQPVNTPVMIPDVISRVMNFVFI